MSCHGNRIGPVMAAVRHIIFTLLELIASVFIVTKRIYDYFNVMLSTWFNDITSIHDEFLPLKWFPHCWSFVDSAHKAPIMESFDLSFDANLSKMYVKQTVVLQAMVPMWRHSNDVSMTFRESKIDVSIHFVHIFIRNARYKYSCTLHL